jgi:hypothetical protein
MYYFYKRFYPHSCVFDLAAIITSRTRLDLLKLFVLHPETELGVRETARKIDSNPMQVRNELILLAGAGLLKSRLVANSIQYSLDEKCKAAVPLRMLCEVGKK